MTSARMAEERSECSPAAEKPDSATWCAKHTCPRDIETDCHRCHGTGEIEDMDDLGGGFEQCYACRGHGVGHPECEWCLEEDDGY